MDKARNGPFIVLIFGIVIVLMLSVMPTMYAEAKNGSFGGGYGTMSNPYIIEDVWDLQNMRNFTNSHYALGKDIDATGTANWNSGTGFEPVGRSSPQFLGSLDGRNRTILGLTINRSVDLYVGLFGYIGSGAMVRNVGLVDCHVTGNFYVGGLAGYLDGGTVTDCYATGTVNGSFSIGGLVGRIWTDGEVSGSYTDCNVYGAECAGGLVGMNVAGTVGNSYAMGDVTGSENVGGLVGYQNQGVVFYSYAVGRVADAVPSGGLVGGSYYGRVLHSFWDMNASSQGSSAGGTGGSTSEMMARNTFTSVGWNFIDTWFIVEEVTYPALRWQERQGPTADAGPDQSVAIGADGRIRVTLDGSGSTDDFYLLEHAWIFSYIGSDILLHGETVEFTFEVTGLFVVTLNVTDAVGNWDTDNMTVGVKDITPPVAEAGPNQAVDEESLVTFDGSASSDNVGVVNWTWEVGFGPAPPSGSESFLLFGKAPQCTFDTPAVRLVTLVVRDAAGNTHSDTMTLQVLDITPPMASAGPDLIVDEGTVVKLSGSGCYDNSGIVNFTWSIEYGETSTSLYGFSPSFTFDTPGSYVINLTVRDAAGHWDSDTMAIVVRDITPPEAVAGPDRTIDEDSPVALDGHLSRDNVAIADYTWAFTCEGDEVVLHGVAPSFVFSDPGVYTIRLTVTDPSGNWDADDVVLTVRDVTAPVAEAGPDRTVPVGTSVFLDGQLSTDNGMTFEGCAWNFSYDGRVVSLELWVAPFKFDVGGVYEVVLTVTDGAGLLDNDTVVITVVDTGRVTGTVLDEEGGLVDGAIVKVTSSNGRTYTTMTAANGTFSLDVYHGAFIWIVMKQGYEAISGSSSLAAMGMEELDLSDTPLVREDLEEPSTSSSLMPVVFIVLLVVLGSLILIRRRLIGPKRGA